MRAHHGASGSRGGIIGRHISEQRPIETASVQYAVVNCLPRANLPHQTERFLELFLPATNAGRLSALSTYLSL